MASLYDWAERYNRLNSQANEMDTLVTMYEKNTRATSDLLKRIENLDNQLGEAKKRRLDAETAASTYDREFIEQKQTLPQPFKPNKLYTLQDFTTFFFFISYFIFLLACSMTFSTYAVQIVVIGIVLAGVFAGILMEYA